MIARPVFGPLDLLAPRRRTGGGRLSRSAADWRAATGGRDGAGRAARHGAWAKSPASSRCPGVACCHPGAVAVGCPGCRCRGLPARRGRRRARLPAPASGKITAASPAAPDPGRRRVPAAGHADVPHRQRRLLPDRHGAAGAQADRAGLVAAHPRHGRQRAHADASTTCSRRPLVERTITMTCVSNPVGGNLISTANFIGVALRDLLLEAGVRARAPTSSSRPASTAGTPAPRPTSSGARPRRPAGDRDERRGASRPSTGSRCGWSCPASTGSCRPPSGSPTWSSPRSTPSSGYWLERGWAQRAPIKTQSRIDKPARASPRCRPAPVTVAGIAWAQPTGHRQGRGPGGRRRLAAGHELSDRGQPGHLADVARRVRRCRPGSHTVQTRATDRTGTTQTEERADPIPDGATGWPATIFTAA